MHLKTIPPAILFHNYVAILDQLYIENSCINGPFQSSTKSLSGEWMISLNFSRRRRNSSLISQGFHFGDDPNTRKGQCKISLRFKCEKEANRTPLDRGQQSEKLNHSYLLTYPFIPKKCKAIFHPRYFL